MLPARSQRCHLALRASSSSRLVSQLQRGAGRRRQMSQRTAGLCQRDETHLTRSTLPSHSMFRPSASTPGQSSRSLNSFCVAKARRASAQGSRAAECHDASWRARTAALLAFKRRERTRKMLARSGARPRGIPASRRGPGEARPRCRRRCRRGCRRSRCRRHPGRRNRRTGRTWTLRAVAAQSVSAPRAQRRNIVRGASIAASRARSACAAAQRRARRTRARGHALSNSPVAILAVSVSG
jgi:hypothetical protein